MRRSFVFDLCSVSQRSYHTYMIDAQVCQDNPMVQVQPTKATRLHASVVINRVYIVHEPAGRTLVASLARGV